MAAQGDQISLLSARSDVVDEVEDEVPVVELPNDGGNIQLPADPIVDDPQLPDGEASDEVENLLGGRMKRQGLAFKMMTALSCGGLMLGMLSIQLMLVWAFGMQTAQFLESSGPGETGGVVQGGDVYLDNNFYISFGYTEVTMVFRSRQQSYRSTPCSVPPACALAANVSRSYCSALCTWSQFMDAQQDWDNFLKGFDPEDEDSPPKAHISVCEELRQANVLPYALVWVGFVSLCMVGLFIAAAIFFDDRLSFGVIICAFISGLCFALSIHQYKNIFTKDFCGHGGTVASELLTPLMVQNSDNSRSGLEFDWGRCPWMIQFLGIFSSLFGCLLWTGSHSYLKNERDRLAYREVFS